MTDAVKSNVLIEKAHRALHGARLLLAENDMEGASNRAYYAMFNAAHAALWVTGVQEPGALIKTHVGLISVFGQRLVKPGIVDAEHGRALSNVQKVRLVADYPADPPAAADVDHAIALADVFVAAMQVLVRKSQQA